MSKRLNVLVACEESQRVCMEFRKLGHWAFSCDLIDCSGGHLEYHIKDDVIRLIKRQNNGDIIIFTTCDNMIHVLTRFDLIIAFPPCTFFCKPSACRLFHKTPNGVVIDEERYKKGLEMKELFMEIYNANCKYISIENPTPMKIWQLPKETQVIQPYQFGEPYTKRTLLWLKGLPKLEPTNIVKPTNMWVNGGHQARSECKLPPLKRSSKQRSKTFQGIARAMAEQWSEFILKEMNNNE